MSWRTISLGKAVAAVAATVVLAGVVSCGGDKIEAGVVMRVRTGSGPEATRRPTAEEHAELRTQIEVVRNYWALPYVSEYELFSSSFKQLLNDAHGVANSADYARIMSTNERQWLKETYKKAELMDPTHGQVTVLADWTEAGYTGVETVIFDTIKEGGQWKISSIFY